LYTHRQTDRQTNKVWQKHYLLGGGDNSILIFEILSTKDTFNQHQQALY